MDVPLTPGPTIAYVQSNKQYITRHVCIHVCMFLSACTYVCLSLSMYVFMHVCMYSCSMFLHTHKNITDTLMVSTTALFVSAAVNLLVHSSSSRIVVSSGFFFLCDLEIPEGLDVNVSVLLGFDGLLAVFEWLTVL